MALDVEALTRMGAERRIAEITAEIAELTLFIERAGGDEVLAPVRLERPPVRAYVRSVTPDAPPEAPARKRPAISEEGRRAIAKAQRKRWRKIRLAKAAAAESTP